MREENIDILIDKGLCHIRLGDVEHSEEIGDGRCAAYDFTVFQISCGIFVDLQEMLADGGNYQIGDSGNGIGDGGSGEQIVTVKLKIPKGFLQTVLLGCVQVDGQLLCPFHILHTQQGEKGIGGQNVDACKRTALDLLSGHTVYQLMKQVGLQLNILLRGSESGALHSNQQNDQSDGKHQHTGADGGDELNMLDLLYLIKECFQFTEKFFHYLRILSAKINICTYTITRSASKCNRNIF